MTSITDDETLISLLKQTRTIAVVGLSPKPERASFRVASYMQSAGFRIIPVRPGGGEILGEPCFKDLDAIPKELSIDLVDVFRRAEDTPPIAEAAVRIHARGIWLQSGILNQETMKIAQQGGLIGIQDLCLMVEHRRLASFL